MMRIAGSMLLLVALTACGSSTSTQPQPSPSSSPVQTCSQSVVDHGNGAVKAGTLYYNDSVTAAQAGRLDFTIDWTFKTSIIGVYVVPANTCSLDEFNARTCNFLVKSEGATTPKPRKVSANVSAGSYRWMIANFNGVKGTNTDSVDESAAFQIVLSTGGGCAPISRVLGSSEGQALRLDRVEPLR